MRRRLIVTAAIAAIACISPAPAQQTVQAELASRRFLIGKWSCSYTVGTHAGTYTTTWSNVLDNRWLMQTYNEPPSQGDPGFVAQYFVGYDPRQEGWVRFGVMTTGQYFAIRMRDRGDAGWAWKYVSFFKGAAADSNKIDATFDKKSDAEYTIDGPTYPLDGKIVSEHHICRKAT